MARGGFKRDKTDLIHTRPESHRSPTAVVYPRIWAIEGDAQNPPRGRFYVSSALIYLSRLKSISRDHGSVGLLPLTSPLTIRNLPSRRTPPLFGTSPHETHVPTECSTPQAQARLPGPHADPGRSRPAQAPSQQRSSSRLCVGVAPTHPFGLVLTSGGCAG